MNLLAETLERFNRKERNLLIRDILDSRDTPLPLSLDFRSRLSMAIGLPAEVLEHAWWATDFHFDWLAGALLIFMRGETLSRQANPDGLIMGTQEDIDLVVVASAPETMAQHLILIEAKAYGYFTTKQFESKLTRLERLYAYYEGLESETKDPARRVHFHYVLYSPTKPTKLDLKPLPWASRAANSAATIEHIDLKLGRQGSSVLAVTRCNDTDKPDMNGKFWRCIELLKATPLSPDGPIAEMSGVGESGLNP